MVSAATLTRDDGCVPEARSPSIVRQPSAPSAATVSVVVVVLVDEPEITSSYHAYRDALDRSGRSVEFIYVLDESKPKALEALKALAADDDEPLKVIALSRFDDEIGALKSAVRRASGDVVLTLPAVLQVEPEDLEKVIEATEKADMAVAERPAFGKSGLYRLQDRLFHGALGFLFGRPHARSGLPGARLQARDHRGNPRLQHPAAFPPHPRP